MYITLQALGLSILQFLHISSAPTFTHSHPQFSCLYTRIYLWSMCVCVFTVVCAAVNGA